MKLVKTQIERTPPPGAGYVIHWDDELPGFGLRVTAGGAKAFVLQYRAKGRTRRMTLGRVGLKAPDQYRREAKVKLGLAVGGDDPALTKRLGRARVPTLRQAAADYADLRISRERMSEATRKNAEANFRRYLPDWLDREITVITEEMVLARHGQIGRNKPAAANLCFRYLRAVLQFAIGTYKTPDGKAAVVTNPVHELKVKDAWYSIERRNTYVEKKQMPDWWQAVQSIGHDEARDFFTLLVLTGLRRSEALGLLWADVDFKADTFKVRDTKNKKDHTLPLTDFARAMLERRKKAADSKDKFVFEGPRGRLQNIRHSIRHISDTTGRKFSPHDTRRTFASFAGLQVSAYVLKKLLNHKQKADVTAGYVQIGADDLRLPLQQVEDAILVAAGVKQAAKSRKRAKQ